MKQAVAHHDPLTASEYTTLGEAYSQKNDVRAAEQQYHAALRKDRKNIPALIALGNMRFEEGDYKEARKYFRKAVNIKPDNASGHNNLAMVDMAEGKDLSQSLKNLENVLPTSGPMRPYILDTLANIAIRQHRLDDARRLIEQARQEAPAHDDSFLDNLAETDDKLAKLIK